MRASETVSEASPGSTASQTGVPTQVVQQVQGTQQVGHAPPPGWAEGTPRGQRGYGYSDLASPTPSPAAGTICSPVLIKMLTAKKKSLPLHPAFPPPRPGLLGETSPVQALLPFPTAATGPDKCAGQAGPRVTPPAHQHPGVPAGKRPASGPHTPLSEPSQGVQPTPAACSDLPAPASRMWGLPWGGR